MLRTMNATIRAAYSFTGFGKLKISANFILSPPDVALFLYVECLYSMVHLKYLGNFGFKKESLVGGLFKGFII
tara:strand:+ start:10578 stop:10796 length:219 start_codon:yes stop_codon:yes gene_type:complete